MTKTHNSIITIAKKLGLGLAGLVLTLGLNFASATPVLAGEAQPATPGKYVVKLKGDAGILAPYSTVSPEKKFEFSAVAQFQNVYSFDSSLSLAQLRAYLAGSYEYLDSETEVNTGTTDITPNDPGFTPDPTDTANEWGLAKAGFPESWKVTKGSRTNVVAIIDTGIDQTHKDLRAGSFVNGYDFVANTSIVRRTNSDDNGHGTLVAGVIGALTNNGTGISGTNWNVTFMPLKALDARGSGTSSDVAEAIVWAADHGANIINMSLGGMGFAHDTTLSNAISYAYKANVVIVAAAGNDAADTGGNLDRDPVFPVCDDNGQNMIIGVTATDYKDQKPAFANFGKACIDVAAPGKRILSTINHDPLTGAAAPNAYAYASGTSLAVPFVVGQAALLRSKTPNATNQQIRDAIIGTADKIDDLNTIQCNGGSCNGLLGAGRINVPASLDLDLSTIQINEGDVVRVGNSGQWYYISGGKRHLISRFVRDQRFHGITPKGIQQDVLDRYQLGEYATPNDATLIKTEKDPTIFYMSKGLRLPVTYQVFLLRGFSFAEINTVSETESNSWLVGSFLSPPEGTLVRTGRNPTVYWVVSGVLHPINYDFYISRGLQIFPVVYVSDDDIKSFAKGDAYVM